MYIGQGMLGRGYTGGHAIHQHSLSRDGDAGLLIHGVETRCWKGNEKQEREE